MALTGILQSALPYIPALVGLYAQNKAAQPTAAERMQEQLLQRQTAYQEAAADPNSPLMKQYTQAENGRLNRNFSQSIQGLLEAQRRQTRLGRTPLFDAERGDEQIWRAGQKAYADNADVARDNARQTILGLATGAGGSAGSYGGLASNQKQRQTQNANLLANTAQSGTDILSRLLKAQQQPQATQAWQ